MDAFHRISNRTTHAIAVVASILVAASAACQEPAPMPVPKRSTGKALLTAPTQPPGCATSVNGQPAGWGSAEPRERHWLERHADLRSSSSHGRAMGPGDPLRGTSWLNRPYGLTLDVGGLFMADRVAANVRSNNDLLGALGLVWDFDHYWGSQIRVAWSTPELVNTLQTAASDSDNLFIADLSALYYPWGDSRLRPYYRVGVGLTDVEYTNDLGRRQQDSLFTVPFGVGLKYQFRRHMAWRLELMDNLAFGSNETSTLNNFSITTGVEWRFGGRTDRYWAWAPQSGSW